MKHRQDIDGLRAVAILPVILFHSGLAACSGGFVGVDVFFVISGFLISGILLEDIRQGTFSVIRFYERRIRRIFPCLFAVLAVSSVGASVLLFPNEFAFFCQSLIAAIFFCSNVLFQLHAGYFDAESETNPLLHTWSLAVEEQFYIIFPLLLWAIMRYTPRRLPILLGLVACTSFIFNLWANHHDQSFSFYMAPARIWELLVGALLAINGVPNVSKAAIREFCSGLGLILILVAVFWFTTDTTYQPGWALMPVLGSALVIAFAPGTIVGKLLTMRPLVFIGLISYSLYLWHWPIIVFAEYIKGFLSTADSLALCGVSIAVATISWRYIERPFRDKSTVSKKRILVGGIAAMAIGTIVGGVGWSAHGWPGRFAPTVLGRLEHATNDISPFRARCHSNLINDIPPEQSCFYGANVAPHYAVWGDSHAVELTFALSEIAARHNASLLHLSSSACPPVLGYKTGRRPKCAERNDKILSFLLADDDINTVVLVGAYTHYDGQEVVIRGLKATVTALVAKGKHVVLVQPFPEATWPIPLSIATFESSGHINDFFIPQSHFLGKNTPYINAINAMSGPMVSVVSPSDVLCHEMRCDVFRDNDVLYFDSHHLSVAGARLVAPLFDSLFVSSQ